MSNINAVAEPELTADQQIEKARKDFAMNAALTLFFAIFALLLNVVYWQVLTSQINSWERLFDALLVASMVIIAMTKLHAAAHALLLHRELLAQKYAAK